MTPVILVIAISLTASYLLTPLVGKLAWKFGAVDHPGERRVHTTPTPRFGGVAIYVAFVAAVLISVWTNKRITHHEQIAGILIAGSLVAAVGVLDDKYNLSPVFQIVGIVAATWVLTRYGIRIPYITNPFGGHSVIILGAFAFPVMAMWVFGVTKTVDLIDGLDGLAAGICAIAAATLLLMAVQAQAKETALAGSFQNVALMAAAVLGASLGFLRHNYPPAKIFMGTVGSQFLGFVLASISIVGAFKVATLVAVSVPVFALGVPIIDAAFVVFRRFRERRPVHLADKTHVHHRLLDRGLSHGQVVLIIYAVTITLSATALILYAVLR